MKKIITSLGMLVFVGALVVGATGAFFSDTETSTGNVFTAGAIDLKIDSEQHYNNAVCVPDGEDGYEWQLAVGAVLEVPQYPAIGDPCDGTWSLTDLQNGVHKFFNFDDIKPGDEGENTISIHIDSNPSWMCADIAVTSNDDVTCNEPELGDDATCAEPDTDEFDGDLAQNLDIFTWLDDGATDGFQGTTTDPTEGDNIWQSGENPLFSNGVGPLSDAIGGESYALADSDTPFGPLPPGLTQYIGLSWCAGDLTIVGPGNLSCNGALMNNAAQTDQALVDITFRVEQARNNEDFLCEPEEVVPVVTRLTLEKSILQDANAIVDESLWTLTASGTTAGTGLISGIEASPTVSSAVVVAGSYNLSESVVAGFTQTGLVCGGTGVVLVGNSVTIPAGSSAVCTFTNTENTLVN